MTAKSLLRIVRLTPPGRGAVATVLVEGPAAREAVESRFRAVGGRALASYLPGQLVFGHFCVASAPGEEVVVRCRGEESVEVHCHGGQAASMALEKALTEQGGEAVSWQQWVGQDDGDPISVAARLALADARTERAAQVLLDQLGGALRRALETILAHLRDRDITAAGRGIDELLTRAALGRHLVHPWHVVLAGAPNVGKSSLINAILGYQRAIVHAAPGTTRDVVSALTAVEGWPVELSDTAGLSADGPKIEQAGVALARERLAAADLVILVFDASRKWSRAECVQAEGYPHALLVHNKCDLAAREEGLARWKEDSGNSLLTSAVTGQGIEQLLRAIGRCLVPDPPPPAAAVPFTAEQIEHLQSAATALASSDVAGAVTALERI